MDFARIRAGTFSPAIELASVVDQMYASEDNVSPAVSKAIVAVSMNNAADLILVCVVAQLKL